MNDSPPESAAERRRRMRELILMIRLRPVLVAVAELFPDMFVEIASNVLERKFREAEAREAERGPR